MAWRVTVKADVPDMSLDEMTELLDNMLVEWVRPLVVLPDENVDTITLFWDTKDAPQSRVGTMWRSKRQIFIDRSAPNRTESVWLLILIDGDETQSLHHIGAKKRGNRIRIVLAEDDAAPRQMTPLLNAWLTDEWGVPVVAPKEQASRLEDPYDWAVEQRAAGKTYRAIFEGWGPLYIAKYGEERYFSLSDPYNDMKRTILRRKSKLNGSSRANVRKTDK